MSQHSAQQQQQQQQQQQDDDLQSEHHSDSPPPQPLLRPAQGAWSAYNFSQLRKATTVTRGDGSSLSSSRLTRPESAERHSQGSLAKASTRNVVEHPMTNATRRQSPNPSSRPYNPNYYPNAAYTQPPLNTQLHNKNNTSYYRSTVSPSSSRERERERDSDQIPQSQQQSSRNNHEERELTQQQQQQNTSSHRHHHHRFYRHSPSPPTFSRESSHSPLGNPGPRNQSPSSPTATPAPTTVHSGTSISQIIAATQPGPVVRDGGGGHFQTSQHQRQHSKSPPISSSRPSGSDPNYKSGSFRPKSASHSSTGMYPFNSLSVTAGVPETGISGNNNANDNSSNPTSSNIPDPNAVEAYTNPAISSAPPNITSPLLAYPSVPDHQAHPHPHMGIAQTLTPSLTPALPPVQTQQVQPPPPQGHAQTQTLTPTITPTSALPPPPSHNVQQHQAHSSPPSTSGQEIVVLLMEDIRFTGSEDPDFQLAEVSVSLREGSSSGGSGEGSSGPWWADGEEVIKALQMTTGRLEGAAKVYARRGKYRQCFVRIAEDGMMECQPSSLLMVSREKTIELIIEPNFESRPAHDPYLYHRSHTPHHPHPHSVAYPLHPHPHSRSTPSRMGMNINMGPGAGSSGGVAMSYDDYYGSPTSTSMAHSHHHSGPPYTTHMGGPPQYYSASGNGGGTSPTFGQKRGHEDDTIPNKRLRTGSGGNGNNNTASGGNAPSAGGGGSGGGSVTNPGLNSVVMDMNTVGAMAAASNSTTSTGQSGSSTVPVEGANPGPSAGGGGGPSNNSSNTGNTPNPSSSTRNRASIGMGLSRPGSRGGLRGNTSSPGNPGSITNNGGNNNNSGLSSNPLSVSIGVRANAPLGLGNVAATASGQLRGSTGTGTSASTPISASGSGAGIPGSSAMTSGPGNHAQRPSSPEEYTLSSQVFPPNSGGRMNNPTFVNHQGGKAPKEIINAAIVAYLRSHIQNEEGYMEFAASKGRLLPIPELLRGYRFAARIVTTWANRKTPPTAEGCGNKRITKNHVLQALFRQTSWGSDCEQTLQLADKYGPGGPFEDPRVVEILNGGSMLPEKGSLGLGASDGTSKAAPGRSQGSVALLDFLKDVDKDYKSRSGGGGGKKPPAQAVVASGAGETSSSRRTPIVTGNPYPSLSTSPIPGGADVVSGVVSNTSVPPNTNVTNNTVSSMSPPTQNPTPTVTPTTSPNLDHAISPNSVTGGVVGEVVQTQMESGPSSITADASLAAATVAGIIAASAASTAVS